MCEKLRKLICGAAALTLVTAGAGFAELGGSLPFAASISASAEAVTGSCGNGVNYTLDNGVLTISGTGEMSDFILGRTPWFYDSDTITKIVIQSGVSSIGASAFYGFSSLQSVTIPDSVKTIGDCAFYGSGLTAVSIPGSVEDICERAFSDCLSLKTVQLGSGVSSIGDQAFSGCMELTSVNVPATVAAIGSKAFEDTPWLSSQRNSAKLAVVNGFLLDGTAASGSVSVPSGVNTICGSAFAFNKNITSVSLPAGVQSIEDHAFEKCTSLTSVSFPEEMYYIGSGVFAGCESLQSISIPYGVEEINDGTFSDCKKLATVNISTTVGYIGESAFSNCKALTSIALPFDVMSIEAKAFAGCTALGDITFPEDIENINGTAFDSTKWLDSKRAVSPLVTVNNILVNGRTVRGMAAIPSGITAISAYAFAENGMLTGVLIPDSVTRIGDCAFADCTVLQSVAVSPAVTDMGDLAAGFNTDRNTGEYAANSDFTIFCAAGSAAATYAANSGIKTQTIAFDGTCALNIKSAVSGVSPDTMQVAVYSGSSRTAVKTPDKNGNVDLSTLAAGDYELVISCNGFAPLKLAYRAGSSIGGFKLCKYGDTNGDGAFNMFDLAIMQRYLCGWNIYPVYAETADVDLTGSLNLQDLALIQRKLCGWDVVLGA